MNDEQKVVTDCCGRLLPVSQTLTGDVHFPSLCLACELLDGRQHENHITCRGECPGSDWSYVDGQIVPSKEVSP